MHYNDPITVYFRGGVPSAFSWRGRPYHVRAITDRWNRTATSRDARSIQNRGVADESDFWQVLAIPDDGESGVYELRYTPRTRTWHLTAT